MIIISVRGAPAPQGSKRHMGHGVMIESSRHVKPWRDAVRSDAAAAARALAGWAGPLDGALTVDMVFTFTRPKGHYRTGRNAHLLRSGAPQRPAGAPDLSKLARATEDALTDAGIWVDDARVVEYGRLAKVYAGEDPDALDSPGAVIRVRRLADPATDST
jgi:Holliday junction resolvase RusA-like endonuclease